MARIAAIDDHGDHSSIELTNGSRFPLAISYPALEAHFRKVGISPIGQELRYSVNDLTTRNLRLCCQLIANKLPESYEAFADFLRQTTAELLKSPYRLVSRIDRYKPVLQLSHAYHFQGQEGVYQALLDWDRVILQTQIDLNQQIVRMQKYKDQKVFLSNTGH